MDDPKGPWDDLEIPDILKRESDKAPTIKGVPMSDETEYHMSDETEYHDTDTAEQAPPPPPKARKASAKGNGAAKPAVKAKAAPKPVKATSKAPKPVKAVKATAKTAKTAKPAPKKAVAVNLDAFGFRQGSKKALAAAMYASKKGATLDEVKEKLESTQLNLLSDLETRGFSVTKAKEAGPGKRQVTRYWLKAK